MIQISIALDTYELSDCMKIARALQGYERIHSIKVHALYNLHGRIVVDQLRALGIPVWIDLKVFDTPNTARMHANVLRMVGADFMTVHASGGKEMIEAAVSNGVKIIGVTALTSFTDEDCFLIYRRTPEEVVRYFAAIVAAARCHGIVCSSQEVSGLKEYTRLTKFTPAIRDVPQTDDQQSIGTIETAVRNGADVLVIGRGIINAIDPVAAFEVACRRIEQAEKAMT